METVATTSGWAFEMTIAYCCEAALSDALTIALSRSTPQYSQPTFDCWRLARSQRSAHRPSRHAICFDVSHVSPGIQVAPSSEHVRVSSPAHERSVGKHIVHFKSPGAQTNPCLPQSA